MKEKQKGRVMPVRISRGVYKLSDSVYAVSCKFLSHVYFFRTYSFIFVRKKPFGLMIVDTGGPGSGELILSAVRRLGFSKKDIKAIALSHWHKDHTGGLAELVNEINPDKPIKVYLGDADYELFTKRSIRPIWFHPLLHFPVPHQSGKSPDTNMVHYVRIDPSRKEESLAEWGIEAIPSQGHTPGHTSYYHAKTGALFSGCGLSIMPGRVVCIVPIFWRRRKMIESARVLSGLDFKFLYPVHFLLEAGQIPKERRSPAGRLYSIVLRFFGFYPLFRYRE
jgi:glyoxylase-like metal-dependent hydrolase (beta-lactamase superfamily II)